METIAKALRLLKELARNPLNVTECAEFLSVHKSSASRLLNTMKEEGYVKLNIYRKFEIGPTVQMLSNASTEVEIIKSTAQPFIKQLNISTNETIHLSILNGTNMTYIDKLDSNKTIRMHSRIGYSYPAYCTAVGKAIVAFLKESDREKILKSFDYEKFTDTTITDAETMRETLKEIRKTGVAYDYGENFESINCIAAPIFNYRGDPVAGVSVAAPVFYTDLETLKSYKDMLLETVRLISLKLGYNGMIPPQ